VNKKTKLYVVLAIVIAAGVAGAAVFALNRGVPAINAAAYIQGTAEPAAGGELKTLPDSSQGVHGMKLVADNDRLSLYFDEESTEIAVRDKKNEQIWRSNPADRQEDAIASPYEKEVLSSQLTVQFRDQVGNLYTYPNYTRSISNKQFTVESIENGIRITYTLGDMSLGIDALPKLISKTRLEEKVLSKVSETSRNYVAARYTPSKSDPELLERLDAQVEKQLVLNKMLAAFAEAGYTEEDLAFDNAENGGGAVTGNAKPNFVIPIEYRLDGDSLLASIPLSQVKESGTYQIRSLELLNFFGAAGTDDEGYILVPDGSGSLIYLNNGKVKEEQYVQPVFGADPNDNSWRRGQVSESARIPVYGMKVNNAAWMAEIEDGAAIASVTATISGSKNSFNNAYTTFFLRGEDWLELYTGNIYQEIQILNNEIYTGNASVRYSFLGGSEANYGGMAKQYRSKLVQEGVLKPLEEGQQLPFYLDIIGSVDKRASMLGIPYYAVESMTTFEEAEQIAEELQRDGIGRIMMRYMGWFGKGISHKPPVQLKVDSVLGNKSDMKQLAGKLEQTGGMLYPDVAFQHIFNDDMNFTPASDAARFVTREVAEMYPYNRALNRMDMMLGTYHLLSAAKLPYYVDKFKDKYESFDMKGVSLRDLGYVLSSDYRNSRVIHRETARHIVEEQLGKIDGAVEQVMIAGGNAYAWAYADHVVNVPMSSSGFNITDESVPFYQMVLHGYMNYTGSAINISDEQNVRKQLLKSIEYGAAPHFVWSYEPSSKLKYTRYDSYFSTQYKDWYEEAAAMYNEANEALASLNAVSIVNRVVHQEGVVEVQYENGTSVIVNYTDDAVTIKGRSIEANHYWIGGERS